MSNAWFESVAEAHRRAERILPPSVYGALVAGSQQGLTLRGNIDSYNELGFTPHIADLPEVRELSTTVMGQHLAMPVMISPTGVQAVHPEGELAVARAAATKGTAMGSVPSAADRSRTSSRRIRRRSSRPTGSAPARKLPSVFGDHTKRTPQV